MLTIFVIGVILGVIVGYYIGRTRAEWGRARHEAKMTIERRHAYRD